MKRVLTLTALVLACMMVLTGCFCQHEVWNPADCVTPKTCAECGETEGEPLGHVWLAATCETPKTCENCGLTEGEAKGHSWADATCEAPKTCETCHLTEGEALGHSWAEATTEAPKTCTNCALTEGERIITDPRFTTAATRDIQGVWTADVTMTSADLGLDDGTMGDVTMRISMDFRNNGDMVFSAEIIDEEGFMAALIDAYEKILYEEFASYGLSKEDADAAIQQEYGLDVRGYLEATLGELDFNELLESIYSEMDLGGVYYIENGKLYSGISWAAAMTEETYTLSGDTLVIDNISQELGRDVTFTRMSK